MRRMLILAIVGIMATLIVLAPYPYYKVMVDNWTESEDTVMIRVEFAGYMEFAEGADPTSYSSWTPIVTKERIEIKWGGNAPGYLDYLASSYGNLLEVGSQEAHIKVRLYNYDLKQDEYLFESEHGEFQATIGWDIDTGYKVFDFDDYQTVKLDLIAYTPTVGGQANFWHTYTVIEAGDRTPDTIINMV